VRAGLAAVEDRALLGLDGDDLHGRLALLEHLADAGDRAAGADAGDDDVDPPSVSFQISSAVVRRWISGLASLANWRASTAPSRSATISSAVGDRALHAPVPGR
jgi:hypothetical protein